MDGVEVILDDENAPFIECPTRFQSTTDAIAVAADHHYVAPAYL